MFFLLIHAHFGRFYSKKNVVEIDLELESLCEECGVVYMNQKVCDIDGTAFRIVGCTLWSHILEQHALEPEMKGTL
jgi:uncharacterized cysteine cluster protein YcgN (CxxCxxCC family)